MAISFQYAADLQSIVTARTTGAHSKFAPGNHRGVVRHSSGIATLTADLLHNSGNVGEAAGDYDVLGFFEFTDNIRIINALLISDGTVGDVDLVAYNIDELTDPEKHVKIVDGLTKVELAGADTDAAMLAQWQQQWPFLSDTYKTKLTRRPYETPAAGYTVGAGELDITAALPQADGSNTVNHGTYGIGLAAASGAGAVAASGDVLELSLMYCYV